LVGVIKDCNSLVCITCTLFLAYNGLMFHIPYQNTCALTKLRPSAMGNNTAMNWCPEGTWNIGRSASCTDISVVLFRFVHW